MEQKYKIMVCTQCFTFNHSKYIEDAMKGFSMQVTTFPVVTLIVDDSSTDGEAEIIRKYLAEHFQNPYRYEETDDYYLICANHRYNSNCNFVVFLLKYNHYSLKKSKLPYLSEWLDNTKYQAVCEGDDYWTDSFKLQKQFDYMEAHPECSLCHTAFDYYYQKDNRFIPCDSKKILQNPNPSLEDIITSYHIQYHTAFMRRSFAQKAREEEPFLFSGYFLFGDTILWFMMRHYGIIHFIPENTGVYRKNDGSSTMKGVKAEFAMTRSAAEFQWYVCNKYSLNESVCCKKRAFLEKASRLYYLFDPVFCSKVWVDFQPSKKDVFLQKTKIGIFWYTVVYRMRKKIGPLYRKFKKAY